jgi:hypothetical protein
VFDAPDSVKPRVLVVLRENWALTSARDLSDLARMAEEAEQAGVDGVWVPKTSSALLSPWLRLLARAWDDLGSCVYDSST